MTRVVSDRVVSVLRLAISGLGSVDAGFGKLPTGRWLLHLSAIGMGRSARKHVMTQARFMVDFES